MSKIFYIEWTEIEFGWGQRQGGISLHKNLESAKTFEKSITSTELQYYEYLSNGIKFIDANEEDFEKLVTLCNDRGGDGYHGFWSSKYDIDSAISQLVECHDSYRKSAEKLDADKMFEMFMNIPEEDRDRILKEVKALNIGGPTYDEYLNEFEELMDTQDIFIKQDETNEIIDILNDQIEYGGDDDLIEVVYLEWFEKKDDYSLLPLGISIHLTLSDAFEYKTEHINNVKKRLLITSDAKYTKLNDETYMQLLKSFEMYGHNHFRSIFFNKIDEAVKSMKSAVENYS